MRAELYDKEWPGESYEYNEIAAVYKDQARYEYDSGDMIPLHQLELGTRFDHEETRQILSALENVPKDRYGAASASFKVVATLDASGYLELYAYGVKENAPWEASIKDVAPDEWVMWEYNSRGMWGFWSSTHHMPTLPANA